MWRWSKPVHVLCVALLSGLIVLGIAPSPATAAVSRYASPNGSGNACTQAAPCSLPTAIDGAGSVDDVFVVADQGDYRLGGGINIGTGIHLHGLNGRPRLIFSDGGLRMKAGTADGLYVEGDSAATAFALDSSAASADRMIAKSGANGNACYLNGATLTNSVCWAGSSNDFAIETDGSNTLRNDTAIGGTGAAIKAFGRSGCGCSAATDTVVNVIARSTAGGPDLEVTSDGNVSMTINVSYSNYLTTRMNGAGAPAQTLVNGGATNQTAAPVFVDPANGNFHEAGGSPTIDGGLNDPANGSADLDGDPRFAGGKTDIGADEVVPAAPAFAGVVLKSQTVNVKGSSAPIKVGCPAGTSPPCTGTLTLTGRSAGKAFSVGKSGFTIQPGKTAAVLVKLSAKALSLLKPGKTLKTTASAVARDGAGTAKTSAASVVLKRR
jgi:hypothetical protein